MKKYVLFALLTFTSLAFARSPMNPPQPSVPKLKWNCQVVAVTDLNDHLFEEGLGSIYDLDSKNAEPQSDEDSATAYLDLASKKQYAAFGQVSWSAANLGEITSSYTYEEKLVLTIPVKWGSSKLLIRAFPASKLMMLMQVKGSSEQLVATADCSGVTDPRNRELTK